MKHRCFHLIYETTCNFRESCLSSWAQDERWRGWREMYSTTIILWLPFCTDGRQSSLRVLRTWEPYTKGHELCWVQRSHNITDPWFDIVCIHFLRQSNGASHVNTHDEALRVVEGQNNYKQRQLAWEKLSVHDIHHDNILLKTLRRCCLILTAS
jgi:hypothetical protein